jgi:hypothetical protein
MLVARHQRLFARVCERERESERASAKKRYNNGNASAVNSKVQGDGWCQISNVTYVRRLLELKRRNLG